MLLHTHISKPIAMDNLADVNAQAKLARVIIEETNTNLFLTGKAGTGKTTFLHRLRADSPKRMVVLAPTGIAAINAKGVTIHSFFQLSPAPYIAGVSSEKQHGFSMRASKIELICSLDLLVIDEVSMVRADLLDEIDAVLKRVRRSTLPFGGLQLLLIGDMHQLAPVVTDGEWELLRNHYETPYFFSSKALRESSYVAVELDTVYRQTDEGFLSLLNSVRAGNTSSQVLEALNMRYLPQFSPSMEDGYIQLCTHNWQAQKINQEALSSLRGEEHTYTARIKGKFPDYSFPTDNVLQLKVGAQVMFVKNDSEKKYFNGMLGRVVEMSATRLVVQPKSSESIPSIEVKPEEWKNTRFGIDEETKEIKEIVDGTFVQYPLKLAWAITIHKSQGLTFDRVMIDASRSFAHGQTYVALSRCRTLEGIVLTSLIPANAIINDPCIERFNEEMRLHQVDHEQLVALKHRYALQLIEELFCFEKECKYFARMAELMQKYLYTTYPKTIEQFVQSLRNFNLEVMSVAARFRVQYQRLVASSKGNLDDEALQERMKKGSYYFTQKLQSVVHLVGLTELEIDNAKVRKDMLVARKGLLGQLHIHVELLQIVAQQGFDSERYLKDRARLYLTNKEENGVKKQRAKKSVKEAEKKVDVPSEIVNAALYERLREWRNQKANKLNLPSYCVLNTKSMMAIANFLPTDGKQLKSIPYLGAKGIEKYGEELLTMVSDYVKDEGKDQ